MPRPRRTPSTRNAVVAAFVAAVFLALVVPAAAMAQPSPPPSTSPGTTEQPSATVTTSSAPAAPSDTTSTTGPPGQRPPPQPGLFDFAVRIRQAVNGWFRDLAASALNPALDLAARSVLATPNLTSADSRVRELWQVSAGMADALFVLLVLAGGILVMGHETVQTRYAVQDVAPRLIVAFLAANLSLVLAGHAIELANAFAGALLGQHVTPDHVRATLTTLALQPLDSSSGLLWIVALVVATLAMVLVGTYIARVALLIVLLAGAPLALATHALPHTEGLALLWWRAFTGCLAVQVGQALTLITAVRVFLEADRAQVLGLGNGHLVDLVVAACLLWMLIRIPVWVGRLVFGQRGSAIVRMARSYVLYRGIRSFGGGA
jgi:hypothetical protein